MAQLVVRNLEESTVRALKERAARNGHSAEEEHREILRRALNSPSMGFKEMLLSIPAAGEAAGDDQDFERQDDRGRDVAF